MTAKLFVLNIVGLDHHDLPNKHDESHNVPFSKHRYSYQFEQEKL